MEKFKIEGFNSNENSIVKINGVLLDPLDARKIDNMGSSKFSWGHHNSGSTTLAKAILMKFISKEYWELISKRLAKRFSETLITGWGDGDFSVEINIKNWLRREGYEYTIAFYHLIDDVEEKVATNQ